MSVTIGKVDTFPNTKPDKAQVLKIGEECMEVFSAWEGWQYCLNADSSDCKEWACDRSCIFRKRIADECADVIQAVCNLLDALHVDDMREAMQECKERNVERGRFETRE